MMAVGTIAKCCCHKVQPHCLAMAILAVPIAQVNWIAAVIRRGPIFNFLLSGFCWVGGGLCRGAQMARAAQCECSEAWASCCWVGKGVRGYVGSAARFREGAWGAWVVDRNGEAWGRCKGSAVRLWDIAWGGVSGWHDTAQRGWRRMYGWGDLKSLHWWLPHWLSGEVGRKDH